MSEGFFDEPEKFKPERFEPENFKKMDKIKYIPFSYGRRRCVGAELGLNNVKMMMICALTAF